MAPQKAQSPRRGKSLFSARIRRLPAVWDRNRRTTHSLPRFRLPPADTVWPPGPAAPHFRSSAIRRPLAAGSAPRWPRPPAGCRLRQTAECQGHGRHGSARRQPKDQLIKSSNQKVIFYSYLI